MAFQLIRSFTLFTSETIHCYYDPSTGSFNVSWTGVGSFPTTVTTSELGASDNSEVSYLCIDGDKHVLFALVEAPFLRAEVEAGSPDCVVIVTPPPVPPTPLPGATPPPLNYICYQIRFQNFEGQIVEANIFDQTTYEVGREIEYRPLKPSGEPVRIECIDNDEDKFTPIKAKHCILEFNSSQQYNLNTFALGQDNRWYVEVNVGSQIKFKGFLVLNDLQEDFLCPPNIVSLTATDSLGLLKDIPLTNFDGISPIIVRPKVPYRWLDYLGWALSKTSLSLPIYIEHNLREEHYPLEPFWDSTYFDAKTFEEEIGTCVNCYEVLETLLGENCFLTQREGNWWVVRVDEIDSRTRYVYSISPDLTSWVLHVDDYDKTIKKTEDIKWIERSAYVQLDRPNGHIKEQYNFTFPKEIIDNIDFSRGGEILIEILPPGKRHYHLLDWTLGRLPGIVAASAYIRRVFNSFDTEIERFAVITKSANVGGVHYIASSRVPVSEKDKFNFSVDRRLELNRSGSGFFRTSVAQIRLYASDGTFYILVGTTHVGSTTNPPIWKVSNSDFTLNTDYVWQEGQLSTDDREWVTTSEDVPPIPKDGEIEILLLQTADIPTTSETHFSNLHFDYTPYINGSYQKFSGQYWQVSQTGEYKATRENDVNISDSPKRLFKGAMLYIEAATSKYKLASGWYDYSLNAAPPEMKPFGWFQAQAVWNQYKRVMRIFDGELLGITDLPDLIHRYTLSDPSPHTRLRYFMLLHFSMSLKSCRWTGHLAEIFKTDEPKTYDDTTVFKFSESR